LQFINILDIGHIIVGENARS